MRLKRRTKIRIGHAVFVVLFFAALEALVQFGTFSRLVLSPPSEIVARLWVDFGAVELWESLATSVKEVAIAMAVSLVIGSALGLAFHRLATLRRAIEPWLVAFYSAPALLLYPVFQTVLESTSATVVAMAIVLGTAPIAINVAVGLAGIEPIWRKLGRSLMASPAQMMFMVLLPAAIPTVVTGFRLGLTFALIGVISLEFLLYSDGLGRLISWRYFVYDTDGVYAAILLVSAIAIAINAALNQLETRVRSRWQ